MAKGLLAWKPVGKTPSTRGNCGRRSIVLDRDVPAMVRDARRTRQATAVTAIDGTSLQFHPEQSVENFTDGGYHDWLFPVFGQLPVCELRDVKS